MVRVVASAPYYPDNFVQPDYPPIAKLAHAEGTVTFTVDVIAEGSTANFIAESGSKLFFGVTEQAVDHWKFPLEAVSQKIHAVVEFKTNCPSSH
jgi:outer membrane biosynthesis protein TonB